MTDNEIIKALECCCIDECEECPYYEQTACNEYVKQGAIDLIKRQQAEVERLNVELDGMRGVANSYKMHYVKAQEDIKELQMEVVKLQMDKQNFDLKKQQIQSEAIKEFAEKLKEYSYVPQLSLEGYEVVDVSYINDLVKEMTEE